VRVILDPDVGNQRAAGRLSITGRRNLLLSVATCASVAPVEKAAAGSSGWLAFAGLVA